jgi:probable HAF family extracellular repeat protein
VASTTEVSSSGCRTLAGDQTFDPFLWDGEKLVDLFTDAIGGSPVLADTLNDAGEIVGQALFSNQFLHAYLWRKGVATDLGTVDGDACSWAHAINSRSQVVGQSFACDGSIVHTFLWENGSMVDLNTLIPPNSNLQLIETLAINDRGVIAGDGLPPGCPYDGQCGHAYVLIPCDLDHLEQAGCEEQGDDATAAMQSSPAPIGQVPGPSIDVGLTPREIAARMRARFGWSRGFVPGAPND